MPPRTTTWVAPRRTNAKQSWICSKCTYVHAGEHTKCNWCDKVSAPVQSPKAPRPKASQSVNAVWTTPTVKWGNWLQVNDKPRRWGNDRPRTPAKAYVQPTPQWSQWSVYDDEEDDSSTVDYNEPDVQMTVAPEGPSDADYRKEIHAVVVVARNAIVGMLGAEKQVAEYDAQILSLRHAIHKDKPPQDQLWAAWQRKSRAEASRDKAIAQAAAACAAYTEAGKNLMIAQDKEQESIASCEAANDYYIDIESKYKDDEVGDTWKSTTPGPSGKDVQSMNQQELDSAIAASSLAHTQLLAASAAKQEDLCKLQIFSVATPTSPCMAPKSKVRNHSPASTSADSILIDDSPARSKCRTDAYQPEGGYTLEYEPPDTAQIPASYGKATTPAARSATPYDHSTPPTPGASCLALGEAQADTSLVADALFGEAPHLGEVRFAIEGPQ
jgi:hypothetical protein